MTEEKKEEKPTAPASAPVAAAPTAGAQNNKEAVPAKREKPANCASCNKSIKNKRWYYRNGKFYCTKTCWQEASKKEAKLILP